jgi:predicted metal-dependent enzyme (double-stranded beta helix superfamily)
MQMIENARTSNRPTYQPRSVPESPLAALIFNLERAVAGEDPQTTACAVKDALEVAIRRDGSFIPERFLQPAPNHYARRLIYMGADRRFSLLAMVWDQGQGTPLHDHGGDWCVECVYRGAIRTASYVLDGERDGLYQFRQKDVAYDVEGQANALVPPLDHHILDNPSDFPAVTLHVYANELTLCNAYLPVDGGYSKKICTLGYTV